MEGQGRREQAAPDAASGTGYQRVGRDAGGGEGSGGTAHPSARFLVHCVDAGVVGD